MEPENSAPGKATLGTAINFERLPNDEFYENYANHVLLVPTAFDLSLVFGKIEPSKGPNNVVQHSAITLPWSQIKVGIYFLQVTLAAHEFLNGRIQIPKGVVNPPPSPTEDQMKDTPQAEEVFKIVQDLFMKFREANPESF